MKWSITVASVGGTRIKIHLTFLLLLVWIGLSYYARGGSSAAFEGVGFILTLFLCVLLHELGHVFAARRYGIPTPDITLLPIGGVARLSRMPEKPSEEIVVAIAGPLVTLAIALVLFVVIGRIADPWDISRLDDPGIGFAMKIMTANIVILLFNLIPAFPMDGGRVLRAILASRMTYARATAISASIGQGFALILGFLGLLYNPLLIFVALFVYLAAAQESASARLKTAVTGLSVRNGMVTDTYPLSESAVIADAVDLLLHTSQYEFPVVDATGLVRGILPHDVIITALREGTGNRKVVDAMRRDIPLLRDTEPLERGLALLRDSELSALPVVDANGRLIGLLAGRHIGEVVLIESAAAERGQRFA